MIPQSVYQAVLDYGNAALRAGRATVESPSELNFQVELDKMLEAQQRLLDLLRDNGKEN